MVSLKKMTVASVVLSGLAALLCGSTPAALAATPVSSASTPPVSDPLESYDAEALATMAQQDPFAGFTANVSARQIVVHAGSSATAADIARLASIPLPSGWTLTTNRVGRMWSALQRLQTDIYTVGRFAELAKPLISVSSLDQNTNSLDVGLTTLPPNIQAIADQTFGVGAVRLHQEDRPTLSATGQSRLNEGNGPFHGGARLSAQEACTQGFLILVSGGHYGLTAGHCGPVGYSVISTGSPYPQIGTITHNSSFDGSWDTAYYKYTTANTWSSAVWRGGGSSTTGAQMKGTNVPTSNTTACTDGGYTFENCHVTVASATFGTTCADFAGFRTTEHVCHLGVGTSQDGSTISQGGDSGGPVYIAPSTGLHALGTIVGGTGGTKVYFQTIQSVLSHWGGSLVTG